MNTTSDIQLIECPRDAMQGIRPFIPTKEKVSYLQMLVECGFHTLDIGSFVSPKAIPQMADTAEVLSLIDLSRTATKLLAIIANVRGAKAAADQGKVDYLGYPFSISETFQMRNTHKTIAESQEILREIIEITNEAKKELVVYISMGFGNPYGEPWNPDIVSNWVKKLVDMGVRIISLSDTVGTSTPKTITHLFETLIPQYPEVTFGAHLHTTPTTWFEKIDAAYNAGCRRFDGAIQGFGGCPMAKDELVGNMPTEKMVSYFTSKKVVHHVDIFRFESTYNVASKLFGKYH